MSALLLPHLKGRPVSLVRAPEGVGGELFFQKHAAQSEMPGVKLLDRRSSTATTTRCCEIDTARGVLSAAQMNVIELHTWNATSSAIDQPDRMTFDLDPGEGVAWPQMQEAAMLVRTLLDRARPAGLPEDQRRQGPARGGADPAPLRLGRGQGLFAGGGAAPGRRPFPTASSPRAGRATGSARSSSTTCATASARPRSAPGRRVRGPGLGVSVPLEWDELAELKSASQWTVGNIGERIGVGNAPWAALEKSRKGLGAAMKTLGYAPPPD